MSHRRYFAERKAHVVKIPVICVMIVVQPNTCMAYLLILPIVESVDKLKTQYYKEYDYDTHSWLIVGCFEDERRFSDLSAIPRLGSRR